MPSNMQSNTLQPTTVEDHIANAGLEAIKKVASEQASQQYQAGGSPRDIIMGLINSQQGSPQIPSQQDILNNLMQLSQVTMPEDSGEPVGLIPALFQAAGGKGFHPFETQVVNKPIGLGVASEIYKIQQTERKNAQDLAKDKIDNFSKILDYADKAGDTELFQTVTGLVKSEVKPEEVMNKYEVQAKEFEDKVGNPVVAGISGAKLGTNAGDKLLMYNALRVFNPDVGLRPGSLEGLEQATNVSQEFRKQYQKLFTNNKTTLLPEQRSAIVQALQATFESKRKAFQGTYSSYANLLKANGKKPEKILRDVSNNWSVYMDGQTATNPQTGQKMVFKEGKGWQSLIQ